MAAHSIDTLRSLYDGTQCIVKAKQGTFAPFPVGCGLRHGCPLSTTLFNLYKIRFTYLLQSYQASVYKQLRRRAGDWQPTGVF